MAVHLTAARGERDTRVRARLVAAAQLAVQRDRFAAEREVIEALRIAPRDPESLHALVELLLHREADPTAAGARLREVARTGEQLCALSAVELRRGQPLQALVLAMRGLQTRPTSWRCRNYVELARAALPRRRAATR